MASASVRATAIVLAGGRSSRFGSDKLAADLHGRPLLHHALRAAASVCDEVVIMAGRSGLAVPVPSGIAGRTLVLTDSADLAGPLVALRDGARQAAGSRLLVVGGDMPALQEAVLARLLAWAAGRQGACLVVAGDAQPLPIALEHRTAVDAADSLVAAGRRSLRDLVAALDLERVDEREWRPIDPEALTLRDIDRPDDLARFG